MILWIIFFLVNATWLTGKKPLWLKLFLQIPEIRKEMWVWPGFICSLCNTKKSYCTHLHFYFLCWGISKVRLVCGSSFCHPATSYCVPWNQTGCFILPEGHSATWGISAQRGGDTVRNKGSAIVRSVCLSFPSKIAVSSC